MRFTDNNAITAANMVDADILAGTDVSTGEDKKFPVGNLADYMLANRTQPVGGANQSITSALNAANNKADTANGKADANTTAISNLETTVDKKADADGEYDDLVVGTSKQLLSESYTEDFTPYKFRKSPYTDRMSESIVGASVAWNQLVQNGDFSNGRTGWNSSSAAVVAVANGIATLTKQDSVGSMPFYQAIEQKTEGHKILIRFDAFASEQLTVNLYWGAQISSLSVTTSKQTYAIIAVVGSGNTNFNLQAVAVPISGTVSFANVQLFDLTQMFGSTVADAIYNMGDSGVALFRSWYPNDYYPYTEATLEHVSGLEAHDMVGFNQWDEEWELGWIDNTGANRGSANIIRSKNYIPVFPSTGYYFKTPQTSTMMFYDENKSCLGNADANGLTDITGGGAIRTTLSNCYYVRIWVRNSTTYNHDICVNISDPTRNGQYKPYEKHSYALDASLTLRGLIKYDATKGFYADGDTYAPDGTVTRKYGIVDLGTLNYTRGTSSSSGLIYFDLNTSSLQKRNGSNLVCSEFVEIFAYGTAYGQMYASGTSMITFYANYPDVASFKSAMSGVMLVYELATPTTEEAEPFEAIQITDGTEEYVSECLVPVGHESKYYANLRSKIEGLPTDFSAIICATEATNKASRNYAVGDYLIYNNTLYKVTTAIAANATLTVGTNITATTIMAEIKALQ